MERFQNITAKADNTIDVSLKDGNFYITQLTKRRGGKVSCMSVRLSRSEAYEIIHFIRVCTGEISE